MAKRLAKHQEHVVKVEFIEIEQFNLNILISLFPSLTVRRGTSLQTFQPQVEIGQSHRYEGITYVVVEGGTIVTPYEPYFEGNLYKNLILLSFF